MKLIKSLSIIAIVYAGLYVGMWGFLEFNNANNSIVALTMYSEYEFNQAMNQKEISENLHIVSLDEEIIQKYPVLLELIKQNQSKEIPINSDGKSTATYEQVKSEVEYIASQFVEKYDGSLPSDFYKETKKDNGWHSISLKEEYFYHDDTLYLINSKIIVISEGEPEIRINKLSEGYDLRDNLTVDLTNEDFESMPRFKVAFDQIGTFEENVQSRKNMNESEFREYEQWAMDAGLADERITFDYGFIKYQEKYYHLYLRA
jgi:hypothetical protein